MDAMPRDQRWLIHILRRVASILTETRSARRGAAGSLNGFAVEQDLRKPDEFIFRHIR